tara:strand:- start:1650 stop:2711 length:1062 start_codon:yes stop_codon:yes gene_type:complete
MKMAELAELTEVKTPNVSRWFGLNAPDYVVKKKNGRVSGITNRGVNRFLDTRAEYNGVFDRPSVIASASVCGGSFKTTFTICASTGLYRMVDTNIDDVDESASDTGKHAIIAFETDCQSTLYRQLTGGYASTEAILVDYFSKKVSVEELLIEVMPGFYTIPSNLLNVNLDKMISTPSQIKNCFFNLLKDMLEYFESLSIIPHIFVDTAPRISDVSNSVYCALGRLGASDLAKTIIVGSIRGDAQSVLGSSLMVEEVKETLSTFAIDDGSVDICCYFGSVDRRSKISAKVIGNVSDSILKHFLIDEYVRFDSRVPTATIEGGSIYAVNSKSVAKDDYTRLIISLLRGDYYANAN